MRNRLFESLNKELGNNLSFRRYSLAEMISESYKAIYECDEDSNLKKLAESHLTDVRNNPSNIEGLSRQLGILKEIIRLKESGQISDEDLDEKEEPKSRREKLTKVCPDCGKNPCVCESEDTDLDEAEDAELTPEEEEELEKHLAEIRKKKDQSKNESKDEKMTEASDEDYVTQYNVDILVKDGMEDIETRIEMALDKAGLEIMGVAPSDTSWTLGEYSGISESVEDFDTNEGKEVLVDEECQDTVESKEERVIVKNPEYCNESLKEFSAKAKDKAFMKTFKKLDSKLHEGTALTRQESINLYKAANSALTHLSVELEHNPEFIETFKESVSILSVDVNKLLSSLSEGKAPSKNTMKSLAKFSEALLNESEDEKMTSEEMRDYWDKHHEDDPVLSNYASYDEWAKDSKDNGYTREEEDDLDESTEDELDADTGEDFVGDDEGDVASEEADAFDTEYAEARVELHKEIAEEHADDEDPVIQDKLAQDAEEVESLPGITDEQIAELSGESEEVSDEEPEMSDEEEPEVEEDSEDITDDELEELKKYLKEMRSARKTK